MLNNWRFVQKVKTSQHILADPQLVLDATERILDRKVTMPKANHVAFLNPLINLGIGGDHGAVASPAKKVPNFGEGRPRVPTRQPHGQHARLADR